MSRRQPKLELPGEVLKRPDMRAALLRHDFGTVFVLARKWAGFSYSRMAEACGIKPERVGRLARGQGAITTYVKICHIADVMRIPGDLLGLSPRDWEHTASRDVGVADVSGKEWLMRRRALLQASVTGVGTAFGLSEVPGSTVDHKVGEEAVTLLGLRTARLRQLDNVLGGTDTFPMYLHEYESTVSLLRNGGYTSQIETRLLTILAEQGQQAGWAAFDSGDNARAEALFKESHAVARRASDDSLAGNALAFLAYQATGGDPRAAVAIAEASGVTAGVGAPTTVKALLHERRAWAHAVAGDIRATDSALTAAREALADGGDSHQPDWSAWVDEQELAIMEGRCWTELRRPLRAISTLEDVLAGVPDAHGRDKALYSCWLADAYVMAGECEAAAMVVDRILDLSFGVASVRPRRRLDPILAKLCVDRAVPAVAAVMERVKS